MTKLRNEFTPKEWKGCCGKGCRKCEIAQAYIAKYESRAEGLKKLNADRAAVKKDAKKGGKIRGGKKGKKKVKA